MACHLCNLTAASVTVTTISLSKVLETIELVHDNGELAIPELKQRRFLRLRILWFDLRKWEVNLPASPTDTFSFPDIPIAQVTSANKAKVSDDCRITLYSSDRFVDL